AEPAVAWRDDVQRRAVLGVIGSIVKIGAGADRDRARVARGEFDIRVDRWLLSIDITQRIKQPLIPVVKVVLEPIVHLAGLPGDREARRDSGAGDRELRREDEGFLTVGDRLRLGFVPAYTELVSGVVNDVPARKSEKRLGEPSVRGQW